MYDYRFDNEFEGFTSPSDSDDADSAFSDPVENSVQLSVDDRIIQAIKVGSTEQLEEILNNYPDFDINTELYRSGVCSKWTPLMYAAFECQPEIISYLLKRGADPNIIIYGMTALMCTCYNTTINKISNEACVKLLLDQNVEVNFFDRSGTSPLMKAIENGKNNIVEMLLPLSNIEMPDATGKTAIFYAVEFNNLPALRLLIDNGASLEVIDRRRTSLKDVARVCEDPEIFAILDDLLGITVVKETYDEHLEYGEIEPWQAMFPNIIPPEISAYWSSVSLMLHGMHCEKLTPTLKGHKISLSKFLALNNEEMMDLNIMFPYQRKRLAVGLYEFHTHPWGKDATMTPQIHKIFNMDSAIQNIGSYLKQLITMESSLNYIIKMVTDNNYTDLPPKLDLIEAKTIVNRLKSELRKYRECAHKANKKNEPVGDLIKRPFERKGIINANKEKIVLFALTIGTIAFLKFRSVS